MILKEVVLLGDDLLAFSGKSGTRNLNCAYAKGRCCGVCCSACIIESKGQGRTEFLCRRGNFTIGVYKEG